MLPPARQDEPSAGARATEAAAPRPDPAPLPPRGHLPLTAGRPRLAAALEVVLCSGFPTQLALAVVLTRVGIGSIGRDGELSLLYVSALSLGDAVLLVGLVAYFLLRGGERPLAVLLGSRPRRPDVLLGLVLIPLTVLLAWAGLQLLHTLWPGLRNVADNPIEGLIRSPRDAAVFAFVAIVAGGVREEIQRAFILRRFEQHLGGGWLGLGVFSIVFGLGHYIQGWDAALVTAVLGAVWGALFLLRRSILPAVISHAGFNASEILIVLAATAGQG